MTDIKVERVDVTRFVPLALRCHLSDGSYIDADCTNEDDGFLRIAHICICVGLPECEDTDEWIGRSYRPRIQKYQSCDFGTIKLDGEIRTCQPHR